MHRKHTVMPNTHLKTLTPIICPAAVVTADVGLAMTLSRHQTPQGSFPKATQGGPSHSRPLLPNTEGSWPSGSSHLANPGSFIKRGLKNILEQRMPLLGSRIHGDRICLKRCGKKTQSAVKGRAESLTPFQAGHTLSVPPKAPITHEPPTSKKHQQKSTQLARTKHGGGSPQA